jgi:hypothetical protein
VAHRPARGVLTRRTRAAPGAGSEADIADTPALPSRRRTRQFARRLLPPLVYVLVAFAYTLPVWRDAGGLSAGGTGDNLHFMNFLAWTPHAVSTGRNPLFMRALFYPHGVNLAWNTSVPLGGLVIWPVIALFGPVVAFNVFVVATIALDGWCTYLWLRRHVSSTSAAVAGGLLVVLSAWIPTHIPQLNLLSFWAIPLLFIAAKNVVSRTRPVLWGVVLGLVAAVQLYLSTEMLALALITLAIALAALAATHLHDVRRFAGRAAAGYALSAVVFAALAVPYIGYQLFGPYRIHGAVEPSNRYVADLQSFMVATPVTWLFPQSVSGTVSSAWTGRYEVITYIGVPLAVIAVYAVARWRHDRLVLATALTTVALLLLSLGPHLHVGGTDTGILLPSIVFTRLPLLDNLFPVRFGLFAMFGLALLLAITLDRTLVALRTTGRRQLVPDAAAGALAVIAVVACASTLPVAASTVTVPPYFRPGGAAAGVPRGSVALVAPYIDEEPASAMPMVWQAQADFRFALIDGLAVTTDAAGRTIFLQSTPLLDAFRQIQTAGTLPAETPKLRATLLAELHRDGVTVAMVGPMPHRELAVQFVSWLAGGIPRDVEGVSVWTALSP